MANNTITIPKKITGGGELVVVPRKSFEAFLKWQKKRGWEEKDTREAVRIFNKARREKKLLKIKSLAELR